MFNVNGGIIQNKQITDDEFIETMNTPFVNEKKYEDVGNNSKIIDDSNDSIFNKNVYISNSLKILDDQNIDPLYRIEIKRMLIDYFMLIKPNDTNLLKKLVNKINNTDLMKNIDSYICYNG